LPPADLTREQPHGAEELTGLSSSPDWSSQLSQGPADVVIWRKDDAVRRAAVGVLGRPVSCDDNLIGAVGIALIADVIEPTDVRAIACHPLSS
jgi:hypothetical protein